MDIKASEGDERACVINADHIPTRHVRGSLCIDQILPDVFISTVRAQWRTASLHGT